LPGFAKPLAQTHKTLGIVARIQDFFSYHAMCF
jgi:hypothetical protein